MLPGQDFAHRMVGNRHQVMRPPPSRVARSRPYCEGVQKVIALWKSAVDLLFDALLGLIWVVLLVTLFVTAVGTIPAGGVGVLLLVIASAVARGAAQSERLRAVALLDLAITPPTRKTTRVTGLRRPFAQAFVDMADPVTWRALTHHLVSAVLGCGFLGILAAVPFFVAIVRTANLPGLPSGTATWVVAGVVVLALAPLYVLGAGMLDRLLTVALLGASRTVALQERIDTLASARQGAVDAASTERQRIERDLHDGVQPRLVALAMTLGMARSRFDSDPAATRELLDQAHRDAKESITELRQLARGIHPAILTDRGLDAALSAVAARNVIPTTVDVALIGRPRPEIEAVLYFAVAEALTNVAKHSGASQCTVTVAQVRDGVRTVVWDDGHGGAGSEGHPGGGLSGMRDRVRAAGGTLSTDSPVGGPTLVTVEVPCAL
ncbi:signal transduction histidine kinase [Curtobacterium sp. PhB142]|nr:signal transduction histidine kinase [Curtobacterium sp. PhB142]TCL99764.1 signal transduction histidine kinase [Curtobacterium sp. PhB134]TCU43928.1 signal transduction histidine kinase [Curtobacterium sp. PhB146]TDW43089.1 signal transduction histidine kinase [Curtobacterium sp. PhB42]TDW53613.1 signal transduction histidine kinase [Curtobacterium sp. PhB190]